MKVLVVQIRRIGDTLMTTPLLRALDLNLPDVEIHMLLDGASAKAVRHNPHVDVIVETDTGASLRHVPQLRRARYDAVLDTLGTPASARLTWLTGAPIRVGPDRPWRRWCYTHRVSQDGPERYSAIGKLAYGTVLGVRSDDYGIEVFPSSDEEREAADAWANLTLPTNETPVAFSPASRRTDKVWPADRYARICDRWHERAGVRYVVVVGPGEDIWADRVIRQTICPQAFMTLPAPLSLGALAPFMRRCAFYFGQDNGIRHVAIAAGLPSAAIFARPDPVSWTPPGDPRHVYVGGRARADAPTIAMVDDMLERLTTTIRLAGRRPLTS